MSIKLLLFMDVGQIYCKRSDTRDLPSTPVEWDLKPISFKSFRQQSSVIWLDY